MLHLLGWENETLYTDALTLHIKFSKVQYHDTPILVVQETFPKRMVVQKWTNDKFSTICRLWPCCVNMVCSRLMKLSDFQHNYTGHNLKQFSFNSNQGLCQVAFTLL